MRIMHGMLDLSALRRLIDEGQIDTVLAVFPDHIGRLMGKRVTGHYFVNNLLDHGMPACNYLLTVDMEMEPLAGFEYTSWEKGYGDFRGRPDLATLRRIPWLEKTALVLCDLEDEQTGKPVGLSPRQILRRQLERAAQAGMVMMVGSELEFYLYDDTYRAARQKRYHGMQPGSDYLVDYHIMDLSKDEGLIRLIRNNMDAAGVPVEFSKGEWGLGQHEINLRYAEALEMADRHVIYKNGVREMATQAGRAITFMAKVDRKAAGSSCHIHISAWDPKVQNSLFCTGEGPSDTFRHFLGGMMAATREMSLFYAPTVNSYKRFQASSFAPTRVAWGYDNRTCGFRIVGHGQSLRIECRIPGADINPYLTFAAAIAGGLDGVSRKIEPPSEFKGDAYQAASVPEVPKTLGEATDEFERSATNRAAFGDDVVNHYARLARLELEGFNHEVTDWELIRYFERI
jgi:glutamine synthetase